MYLRKGFAVTCIGLLLVTLAVLFFVKMNYFHSSSVSDPDDELCFVPTLMRWHMQVDKTNLTDKHLKEIRETLSDERRLDDLYVNSDWLVLNKNDWRPAMSVAWIYKKNEKAAAQVLASGRWNSFPMSRAEFDEYVKFQNLIQMSKWTEKLHEGTDPYCKNQANDLH